MLIHSFTHLWHLSIQVVYKMSGELDKSWIFENDRFGKVYRDGVKFSFNMRIHMVLVDEPHLDCLLNVYGSKRPRMVPKKTRIAIM